MKVFLLLLFVTINVVAADRQVLLISDHAFYLDGSKAQQLSEFEGRFDRKTPIIVKACSCAQTDRLTAVLDWLTEKGKQEVMVSTIRNAENELCGGCQ